MKHKWVFLATLLMLSVAQTAGAGAGAGAADPNAQKALAKAQFMLRQAATEKAAAEQQVQVATQELAAMEAEVKQLEKALVGANDKENKYKEVIAAWKNKYQQLVAVLGETRSNLGVASQHGQQLSTQLATQVSNFDLCLVNNKKLYDINRELLAHYENKSAWDALAQKEPVTGLKKVEVENLIQDYQYRIEDLHISSNDHAAKNAVSLQETAE